MPEYEVPLHISVQLPGSDERHDLIATVRLTARDKQQYESHSFV